MLSAYGENYNTYVHSVIPSLWKTFLPTGWCTGEASKLWQDSKEEESGESPRGHTSLLYCCCSSSWLAAMLQSNANVALVATGEREEAPESDAGDEALLDMGRDAFATWNGQSWLYTGCWHKRLWRRLWHSRINQRKSLWTGKPWEALVFPHSVCFQRIVPIIQCILTGLHFNNFICRMCFLWTTC